MRPPIFVSSLLLIFLSLPTAEGWGRKGHYAIAHIAQRLLEESYPDVWKRVKEILAGQEWEDANAWADTIRDEHPEASGWHFINTPDDQCHYYPDTDCPPDKHCLGDAIPHFLREVRRLDKKDRGEKGSSSDDDSGDESDHDRPKKRKREADDGDSNQKREKKDEKPEDKPEPEEDTNQKREKKDEKPEDKPEPEEDTNQKREKKDEKPEDKPEPEEDANQKREKKDEKPEDKPKPEEDTNQKREKKDDKADDKPDAKNDDDEDETPKTGRSLLAAGRKKRRRGGHSFGRWPLNEALKMLAHLCGDITQPLHVSRKSDYGGNSIQIKVCDREQNLHKAWDTGILYELAREETDGDGIHWREWLSILADGVGAKDLKSTLRRIQRSSIEEAVNQWAEESAQLACSHAYFWTNKKRKTLEIMQGDDICGEYIDDNAAAVIDRRLRFAGVNLAAVLILAFDFDVGSKAKEEEVLLTA
uniref:Uncharacterized protein n=1 Tax=Chromera velia CCMP2878 TaxID=1169474 RepID=A0A0G4HV60_9ALVE|eukprot:Cvel_32147.t1-p1 / transcript=Cvel_32147.t1 / gene=Cvel_32147 / organism=Chromera_velia_CCMP2878 / gene_product=Endonuclease 1, putative / transcript_product=Endonuclease 1, putative / location=Cvel_scaffold4932:1040-4787(+) / protein_length=473 / sequence_SO=supercontig / SO=protein_coding / is_pseudo=false